MNHFEYRDGVLYAEDVPVPDIAKAVGNALLLLLDGHWSVISKVFSKAFDGVRLSATP